VSVSYTNQLRTQMTLQQPGIGNWIQYYAYNGDWSGRLSTVVNPAGYFTYAYKLGAGPLIRSLLFPNNCAITNAYDAVGRLTETVVRDSAGTLLNSHAYTVNTAGERTRQTRADGSYVDYGYDGAARLVSAKGKESGGGNRLHEQLGYAYDAAGNLWQRTNNALVQTFTVNTLDELSTATRAGTYTAAGAASAPATGVTVNGSAAALYGDKTFARDTGGLTNGLNSFTAVAQDGTGRSATNTVSATLPATVSFTYDGNGNLTGDGTRLFDYDDDDQLIRVTVSGSWKTEWVYDGLQRVRVRRESTWSGGAWNLSGTTCYVYDGKRVIQERDGNNVPTVTYTRGLDLSGSLEGAGGIGGLLMRADTSSAPNAYYQADGSGNVTALFTAGSAAVGLAAKYWYDPYGNIVAQTGPLAEANVYRFSSKEYHPRSGLYYFGRRFYDPNLQRWLSRDSIGIDGGVNLYAFVKDSPVTLIDPEGAEALGYYPDGTIQNPFQGGQAGPFDDGFVSVGISLVSLINPYAAIAGELIGAWSWAISGPDAVPFKDRIDYLNLVAASLGRIPAVRASGRLTELVVFKRVTKVVSEGKTVIYEDYTIRQVLGRFLKGADVKEAGDHAKQVGVVTGVVDRDGAAARRAARLRGRNRVPGQDLDEYPPAVIRPDDPSHNRRSGGRLRGELPPNGTPVIINPYSVP
jgi:RHS repeat-associated protein